MVNTTQNFALVAVGIALGLPLLEVDPAQAIQVNFEGTVTSGSLIDQSYSGLFNFDNTLVNSSFTDTIPVDSLQFSFLMINFTQADASTPPSVEFLNGDLLGLNFAINNANTGQGNVGFSFVPGFADVSEAFFAYDVANPNSTDGFGTVSFVPVPEPASVISSGIAALGFFFLIKKRRLH